MKKTLLIALLFSCASHAQIREKGEIEVSPFVGFSTSSYYGSTGGIVYEPRYSVYFGVNGDFYLNEKWSIRTGVEYQRFGTTEAKYFGDREKIDEKLNFVAVPLHANIHFGKKRNWNINFGPTVAFLTSANSDGVDVTQFINPVHVALGAGVGYKFYINDSFGVQLNYQQQFGVNSNFKQGDFMSSVLGGFNVKAVFKLGSKPENDN